MASDPAPLPLSELEQRASRGEIDTVFAGFTDLYGRLLGKRFDAGFFVEQVAKHGTHACDYLLTVDMEMEPISGYEFSSWAKGYGDVLAAPDLSTLRVASWLDRTAMVLCDVVGEDGTLVPQAPRTMLKRQLEGVGAVGFVQDDHAIHRAAQHVKLPGRIVTSTWSVGRGDECQRR